MLFGWKECPGHVNPDRRYSVYGKNDSVTGKTYNGGECAVIGNKPLPPEKLVSWNVKILKSKENNGKYIYIGVAPSDINQNEDNSDKCGWYLDCSCVRLRSGPPHKYIDKEYASGDEAGNHRIMSGSNVGVMLDTRYGNISFSVDKVDLGVAYEGVPLDKPLVPCVILCYKDDSVTVDEYQVKDDNVCCEIPTPSDVVIKSSTFDKIILTWNQVDFVTSYQVEFVHEKGKFLSTTKTPKCVRTGLEPATGYDIRVRAVKNDAVGEWSSPLREFTQKHYFETSGWKECPDSVEAKNRYFVDERNPTIATKVNYGWCTVVGNIPIPHKKVVSWGVKILKSRDNNGNGIFIGVVPIYIFQDIVNYNRCGWYYNCYFSALYSGPPQKYDRKEYGPQKEKGTYIHEGDIVGVIVDTELNMVSFAVNGENHGMAYERIPLDEPLAAGVILGCSEDSVELITDPRRLKGAKKDGDKSGGGDDKDCIIS